MTDKIQEDVAGLQADIDHREAAVAALVAERNRLEAQITAERDAVEQLRSRRDMLRIQAIGETTAWAYLLNTDDPAAHQTCNRLFREVGFSAGGQCLDTGQTVVRFMLTKGRPGEVERACAFVRQVLPAIQPRHGGSKWLSVFEWTLSQYGTFRVRINEAAREYAVVVRRSYRESEQFTADNLEALVQYLHDHHYYARLDADE
jgi:chorismate mutase